jgi:oligoendopeptidase F
MEQSPTPSWNRAVLVKDASPRNIIATYDDIVQRAMMLERGYRDSVDRLDAIGLYSMIKKIEDIKSSFEGSYLYAYLGYMSNSSDSDCQALYQVAEKRRHELDWILGALDSELIKRIKKEPSLLETPALEKYGHVLKKQLSYDSFSLERNCSRLLEQKDIHGVDAWFRLHQELLSSIVFKIDAHGQQEHLSFQESAGMRYFHPDREIRKVATKQVFSQLAEYSQVWSTAFRSVAADYLSDNKLRGYSDYVQPVLLNNDIERRTLDSLLSTVKGRAGLYKKYVEIRRRMLGVDRVGSWDLTGNLYQVDRYIEWEEAVSIVSEAYSSFDGSFGRILRKMIENKQVDAKPRKGKVSFAFGYPWYSAASSWVSLVYTGNVGDLFTMAHEFGHAIHNTILAQTQPWTVFWNVGRVLQESVSVFGELLLSDYLCHEEETAKTAALLSVLDQGFTLILGGTTAFLFEKEIYHSIEEGVFLDGETISQKWVEQRNEIFSDAIEWLPENRWAWVASGHYFRPRARFYNFQYAFGQLLAYAIYESYRNNRVDFIQDYKEYLRAGGTASPRDLLLRLNLDINDPDFWSLGFDYLEKQLEKLSQSVRQYNSTL